MSDTVQAPPAQLPVENLTIAEPPPEPDTLGQTPHEPRTRPWEQELLISGATVFALLQLPPQVDAWHRGLMPRLDGGWFIGAMLTWMYVKLALYALICGFLAHLAIRAYWVGVIGLEATFPSGINWDKVRSGPIIGPLQRARAPKLQTLIDRADRLASVVFAAGITIALFCVFGLVLGSVVALGTVVASHVFGGDGVVGAVVLDAVVFAFVVPLVGAVALDRAYGSRLDPDGRLARVVRRIGVFSTAAWKVMPFMPLLLTMVTNLRRKKGTSRSIFVVFTFALLLMAKDRLAPDLFRLDGYRFLPDEPGAATLETRFYEDARSDEETDGSAPSIQSDMVRDPYVRLFIPYRPVKHNELIAGRCGDPDLAPPSTREARVIACMLRLQPVAMDGAPVSVPFRLYTQPKTELRGIVGYIPVDALTKGEHVITVGTLPPVRQPRGETPPPKPPFSIRFWL